MQIRHADPSRDATACAEIYAPFVNDTAVSLEEVAPDAVAFAQRIARLTETHAFLVATDDDGVGGFAYASRHHERVGYRWAADISVYVHHRCRGSGVGRALYDALFGLLRRQGILVVCAGITLPNPASVALHEACGLDLVGVYRQIGWKAGAWRDVGWWQGRLDGGETLNDPAPPPEPGPPARLASS